MAYWLLVEREAPGKPWEPQFGDKDKEAVEFERDDYADHGKLKKNMRILRCAATRAGAINEAVKKLNEKDGL